MRINFDSNKRGFVFLSVALMFLVAAGKVTAQIRRETVQQASLEGGDDTWWYVTLFVLILGLAGAIFWLVQSKKTEKETKAKRSPAKKEDLSWDTGSLDADREMEWLRKNQNLVDKKRKRNSAKKARRKISGLAVENNAVAAAASPEEPINEANLPVFTFDGIEPAKSFTPLPLSNDESLLNAIEQAQDEYEEDEAVRDLAVRILMAFKMRNSIEALSQMALYDLSSSLRSKAVLTLTEFDHESVFETILLACADPTREVRAAAARGLTRLSFDRADAWTRIAETGEKGRMRQAARAAIESGFVEMSFDRLIHPDRQHAYEAFVLLSLLVKSGETEPVFETLKNHKNKTVKSAILHLIKVTQDENALDELNKLAQDKKISRELKDEINKTVEEFGLVAV